MLKFRNGYENPFGFDMQDLSDPYQDLIKEIPPFTKDDEGKWLNETSVPKYVKVGKINVQEQIQSFADEVDLYKILEQFAATGDDSLLNRNVGFYIDSSDIPTNFNDFQAYLTKNEDSLKYFSKDVQKAILNGDNISSDIMDNEVKRIAKEHYNVDFDNLDNSNVEKKESDK